MSNTCTYIVLGTTVCSGGTMYYEKCLYSLCLYWCSLIEPNSERCASSLLRELVGGTQWIHRHSLWLHEIWICLYSWPTLYERAHSRAANSSMGVAIVSPSLVVWFLLSIHCVCTVLGSTTTLRGSLAMNPSNPLSCHSSQELYGACGIQ